MQSLSNLTEPTPRPGFKTKLNFDESVMLNPLEVYANAIELMSVLAKIGWTHFIIRSMAMTGRDYATEVALYPKPRGSSLETDIAVSGLYQACMTIAERKAFYKVHILLLVNDQERGGIIFSPRGPASTTNVTLLADSAEFAHMNATPPAPLPYGWRIHDPKDKKFTITYMFDNVKIGAKEIFTSFLNALAISAQHANTDLEAYVPVAPSADGEVLLSTWTVAGSQDSMMTWARLKRALLVLWERVVFAGGPHDRPIFEGFEFGLEYDRVKIGAGRLWKFDGPKATANGTDAVAVAR